MKKGFKAVGKAVLYFGLYCLVQFIVSAVFSAAISAKMTVEMMETGEELDVVAMTERLMTEIMSQVMLMTLIAGIFTLLVLWIIFLIRKKKFMAEVCIRPIPVKGILPIALMAACFNVITSVLISIIPWPQGWMDSYVANSAAIDNSLVAWITAVLMAPVLEEVVFRGLIYTRLKKGLPVIAAAVIASLVFGIMHGTIIWAIYTSIFSLVLIWVFEKFQSLTACILLHMAYNLSGMALSLIPEDADVVIWVLFAACIVGAVFAYKLTIKATEGIERIEEVVTAPEAETVEEEPVQAE